MFGLPAIGGDFSGWTLKRAKEQIDKCTKPPKFKWTDTPLSRMIKEKSKSNSPKKEQHTNEVKGDGRNNPKPTKGEGKNGEGKGKTPEEVLKLRPDYEKPSAFPGNLKAPGGNHAQKKQLYDNTISGACTRCHKHGHLRRNCPEAPKAWEKNFDKKGKKGTFWQSIAGAQNAIEPEQHTNTFDLESFGTPSFEGGNALRATSVVRTFPDKGGTNLTRARLWDVTAGLDSQSDISIAGRKYAYGVRPVIESVNTGGGIAPYSEEGILDTCTSGNRFEPMPVLVANERCHLPRGCQVLVGQQQVKGLNTSLGKHGRKQFLPPTEVDVSPYCMSTEAGLLDDSDGLPIQMMSGKGLVKWWEKNKGRPVGHVPYTVDDVGINPNLPPEHISPITSVTQKYRKVFDATKGALPKLANHPPVELHFKGEWKPVPCPEPRWGPGSKQGHYKVG